MSCTCSFTSVSTTLLMLALPSIVNEPVTPVTVAPLSSKVTVLAVDHASAEVALPTKPIVAVEIKVFVPAFSVLLIFQ